MWVREISSLGRRELCPPSSCLPMCPHLLPPRCAKGQADMYRERHLLAVSLGALRRLLAQRAAAEVCLRRLLNRQLAAAFAAWRERAEASRAMAASAAAKGRAVVLRMQNRLASEALAAWRAHTQRNRRLRHVLARIQQRGLLAALHSWRDWTARMARARQLMRRSLAGTQAWAFAAWREAAATAAEERWVLEQVHTQRGGDWLGHSAGCLQSIVAKHASPTQPPSCSLFSTGGRGGGPHRPLHS